MILFLVVTRTALISILPVTDKLLHNILELPALIVRELPVSTMPQYLV